MRAATYRMRPIGSCLWTTATAELRRRAVVMSETAVCPVAQSSLSWSLPFVAQVSPTFQLLVRANGFGGSRVTIVDRLTPSVELSASGGSPTVAISDFVGKGMEHIGAAPSEWHDDRGWKWPEGLDHIVFLIALMLGGGTLLQLIGIASGFTLGHSITLALAATGLVRPPSRLIEALVALTIAVAAVEAFSPRLGRHRWKIAAAFGLIHGFGFASALDHFDLGLGGKLKALFGYNLGVELGQVAIVLAIAPIVIAMYRRPAFARVAVRVLAAPIFVLGLYWFVVRAFALG